jgi:TPR repeat protein
MCYLLGEGYAANPEAAACWLREAARVGNERARAELKRMKLGEDPGQGPQPAKSEVACNFAPFGAP